MATIFQDLFLPIFTLYIILTTQSGRYHSLPYLIDEETKTDFFNYLINGNSVQIVVNFTRMLFIVCILPCFLW